MQSLILHRLYKFYYASQHSNKRTPYKKFEEIMANRDILKEAIADAKAVKETAIANAKIALEEAFTPFLQEKFAAKLAEIDKMEEGEDESENNEYMEEDMYETKDSMDEINLDELLRELDNMEEEKIDEDGFGKFSTDGKEGFSSMGEKALDEAEEEEMEEEFDIESMSEEDLKSFIEDVISDMVEAGELEAGHEGMEDEVEVEDEEEEEVNLDELLREMSDEIDYDDLDKSNDDAYEKAFSSMDEARKMKKEKDEMKRELDEAYKALNKIQSELNEINLLNSKLLYSNKVFKAKNLTESQKVKVLAAFDKAASKKEAQLVYETVMENLNAQTTTKRPMTESVRGMASRVIAGAQNTKQPIIEVNSAFDRMQKLAGIKK
jgi:uncharacterized membrane protein